MTVAVIYARYSSDMQSAASIDDQVRLCRIRAEREGWTPGPVYADRATSGASALRAGYQKLLEDARKGLFQIVLAEALDRMSRDQEHVAGLFKQLSFAGVKLVTLAEGEISELHVGLKGTMNALFLKDLADKTRRGLRGRIEAGRSGGGNAYGYKVVRELDGNGEPVAGGRAIDEREAAIIRRIFTEFAAGKGPRAICRGLNAEGIRGPGGRPWGDTTIRGHDLRGTGILRNELYVGRMVWNRLRYAKDPNTGKRLSRLNPPELWVTHEMPELRIVDDKLWQAVRDRLDGIRASPMVTKARATKFWERRRANHLLTGLAHCGVCGAGMAAVGRDYLACGTARRQGGCANTKSVRRKVLEDIVLDGLRHRLMAPDLVAEFITRFQEEMNRQQAMAGAGLAEQRRELAEVEKKLDALIEAIANGLRSAGLQSKLDDLESRKTTLLAALDAPAPSPVRLHPNLAEVYRRKVAALSEALNEPATRHEALEIVRSLIERVDVRPAEKGVEVELVGEIAAMVALGLRSTQSETTAHKGAAVSELFARSVKVVAGARNRRDPTFAFSV